MGAQYTVLHAAACASCCSTRSALWARMHPDMSISIGDFPMQALMHAIKPDSGECVNLDGDATDMAVDELDRKLENTEWRDISGE